MTFFEISLIVVLCLAVYFYNKFVVTRNRCLAAWADVDVQLVRRHELIPNLVRTVKGYAEFETRTLELITLAKNYQASSSVTAISQMEQELSRQFSALYALVESYPEIKANRSYLELCKELVETEDAIQHARRYYNGTVRAYNTLVQQFPNMLLAKLFRFNNKPYFSLARQEHGLPVGVKLT